MKKTFFITPGAFPHLPHINFYWCLTAFFAQVPPKIKLKRPLPSFAACPFTARDTVPHNYPN
jgi:hypothetical protein